MRKLAITIGACLPLAALWSCAGSNGNGTTGPPTLQGSSTQSTPTATATQSITAAAGGKVVLSGNGPN